MKKILSLSLALIMILSLFAGCNQSKKPGDGPISNEATVATDDSGNVKETLSWEEKFGEHVTLTWCFPDARGVASFAEWDRIVEAINEITKKEINATINIEIIPLGEYTDKMSMKYIADEKWDICFSGLWNPYADAVGQGAFVELPMSFLQTYAPESLEVLNPVAFEALTLDGKLYAMPIQQIYVRQSSIQFETDWAKELNFDWESVKTLEDLEPYFDLLLANGYTECLFSTGKGLMDNLQSYLEYDYLSTNLTPGVVNVYDSNRKVYNQYESAEFRELAMLMKKWHDKGYFTDAAISGDQENPGFEEDRHPVSFSSTNAPGDDEISSRDFKTTVRRVSIGKPAVMTTTGINVTTMAVSANCENPGRAMAFINLLNTNEELLNLICHGEEGVDWNWVDKEQKLIEATEYACPGNYAFLVGNGFIEYYVDPAMVGAWKETAQINATAAGSSILGFTFNAEPVSGELANMNALIDEQVDRILTGMAGDVDAAIAKLNADLYAAGLEIVLDEMQAQVDAWAATK